MSCRGSIFPTAPSCCSTRPRPSWPVTTSPSGPLRGTALAGPALGPASPPSSRPPPPWPPSAPATGPRSTTRRSGWGEGYREVLDPVDEAGAQGRRGARHLEVGEAGEEFPEHHRDLPAGEVGAEAEVGPGRAEADVGIRIPAHAERIGGGEDGLVAGGGVVEKKHLVAGIE